MKTFQALIAESLQRVDEDTAIDYFAPNLRPEQLSRNA
jgi:hypothetical protein